MKAKLEFTFDLPSESYEYNTVIKARENRDIVDNIKQYFRRRIKYDNDLTEENLEFIQDIFDDIIGITVEVDVDD